MTEEAKADPTAPEALKQWRAAERTVAVARRQDGMGGTADGGIDAVDVADSES